MKYLLSTLLALAALPLFSQIKLQIEVLPDNETYMVSFISEETYPPPSNTIASGQLTIRVPHGLCENRFEVAELTMVGGEDWQFTRYDSPPEAPSWDYIFFGIAQFASSAYLFEAGVKLPIFTFKNGASFCAHQVEIIDNETDPFLPPNSANANIANYIAILGGGLNNVYSGAINTGIVDCLPETVCLNEAIENIYLCPGQTYMGQTFLQDTTIEEHYTSCMGCDSVFITNIYSWIDSFPPVDTAICQGKDFDGTLIMQDEVITITHQSFGGCDSTVTYNIEAIMPIATSEDVAIVEGQTVNGVAVYSDSVMVEMLFSVAGCDSTHTTNVTVYQIPVLTINEEICSGEFYLGQAWPNDTTLIDSLTTPQGFDSLVITNIFVNPVYQIVEFVELCEGGMYGGQAYFENDTLTSDLQTILGCDSTSITYISVQEVQTIAMDTSICAGESIFGEVFENDTTFMTAIPNEAGCDSVVFLTNLTVFPAVDASIAGEVELCAGESTELTAYGGVDYEWSTSQMGNSIQVDFPDAYAVTVTSQYGCTATAEIEVFVSNIEVEVESNSPPCFGDLTGSISFNHVEGGFPPYIYSVDGGDFFTTKSDFSNLSPGTYNLIVEDNSGCSWTQSVDLNDPANFILDLGPDLNIRLGEEIVLEAMTNFTDLAQIQWLPESDTALCDDCLSQLITPLETTNYRLVLTDSSGCTVETSKLVRVESGWKIYVPTAFSPNGDGPNDLLTVQSGGNVARVRQFIIFERWGGQVFKRENFPPNDFSLGWDGQWQGKPAQTGTYVWMAEVEFIDGVVEVFEGGVLLLR